MTQSRLFCNGLLAVVLARLHLDECNAHLSKPSSPKQTLDRQAADLVISLVPLPAAQCFTRSFLHHTPPPPDIFAAPSNARNGFGYCFHESQPPLNSSAVKRAASSEDLSEAASVSCEMAVLPCSNSKQHNCFQENDSGVQGLEFRNIKWVGFSEAWGARRTQ